MYGVMVNVMVNVIDYQTIVIDVDSYCVLYTFGFLTNEV